MEKKPGNKINDKEIEKKLMEIKVPEPDEARKEAAIMAAADEFERAYKEEKEKSKASAEKVRHKGKKEKNSIFRGGTLMTRHMFATLSAATVAIVLTLAVVNLYTTKETGKLWETTMTTPPAETSKAGHLEEPAGEPAVSSVKGNETGVDKRADADGESALIKNEELKRAKVRGKLEMAEASKDDSAPKELFAARASKVTPDTKPVVRSKEMVADVMDGFEDSAGTSSTAVVGDEVAAEVAMEEELDMVAPSVAYKTKKPSVMAKSVPAKGRIAGGSGGVADYNSGALSPPSDPPASYVAEYSGRDKFEVRKINPVRVASEEPVSTFSIDVDTASYAFMRRALNNGHLPQKHSIRVEELINYFDYDYEVPDSKVQPFKPTVALYQTPWNKDTKLMHIGIKGHEITDRKRANLVFLIDVSGSMSSMDKLPLLKRSLQMMVGELHPDDTVSIAVYAGAAGTVLEPTKVKDKSRIIAALERLQSGGSTAGGAGIKLAYSLAEQNFDKEAVNRVILATDGDFNVGISNPDELQGFVERKRETGVFLSVLGFGQGNYNDELMQKLAQNGNGNAAYIDTLSEARKVLVDEATSTLFTIAKDVKIQVEFNPEKVAEYRLIGYESRMLKREDFSNDKVDAGEVGAGHTVTAIYEITPVGSPATVTEPLRYSGKEVKKKVADKSSEYAFLRIRYKLPDEDKSRLLETPVNASVEFASIEKAPREMRFAAAVAAFGQILKGGTYTGDYSIGDVIELARGGRGEDRLGYRSEFLSLLRLAETASVMGDK